MSHRIVVGISGASGAALGIRVLERLAEIECVETHLVISRSAELTIAHEVAADAAERVRALADVTYPSEAVGAAIASGSFRTAGMIVAPCSMRSLSAIAHSLSDNLLIRAADVQLKERRRLVLVVRETPLHLGHLRAMVAATEMGAIIAPPVPAFYRRPASLAAVIDDCAGRAIDLLGLGIGPQADGWTGDLADRPKR
ncbi:UbiX family flavin prenyltransferase [Devosia sp.]|uniref:UbiX family flavin prenyltransferase n=1 Tax=Devosia sp. TaxID=1871048 RepID=UPI001AC2C908|nr:UbiX family flavin prenyltransferase [Devosia sp.]MBN9310138.1 UbiX family flavin prenyltransferase [Devosia sp.]